MTHAEADAECRERNETLGGDQPGVHWMVREASPGDWRAVRVVIPGVRAKGPLHTSTESRPRPDAPDPRSPVNPNWGLPF